MSMLATAMVVDPWATNVLKKGVHDRLVDDITNIARDASIQPKWIWTALHHSVSADEVAWVKRFKFHKHEDTSGLCLVGSDPHAVIDRMAAIAGALVRNFVRAQVFTMGQLISVLEDRESSTPASSCVLIPNFFLTKAQGGGIADWRVSLLYDFLVERHLSGLQTVIYVLDMKALGTEYGAVFAKHIKANYRTVNID